MTSEIQQNRYDRLMRRVAGIIGPGSKVSEVLTELFPMIDVEGNRGELQLLGGTLLGMGAQDVLSLAAEFSAIQLFNPVGSSKIITITSVYVSASATQRIRFARDTTTLTDGIATEVARDLRQIVTSRPVGQMFSQSSAGGINANMQFRVLENDTLHLHDENGVAVLPPGTGLSLGATAAQTSLTATFFWRERVAETSELNF